MLILSCVACQSTNTENSNITKYKTHPSVNSDEMIYSPQFLMRYKDLLNAEQRRIAWDLASNDMKSLKDGNEISYHDRFSSIKDEQKFSLMGKSLSSLRTLSHVSGIIKFEGDELPPLDSLIGDYRKLIYQNRVLPAFDNILDEFSMKYRCIYNCDEENYSRIYEFYPYEHESVYDFVPEKIFASVCIGPQKKIPKLSEELYDLNKKAIYTNSKYGMNIVFSVYNRIGEEFNFNALEGVSSSNKYCVKPKGSIEAFSFLIGRDLYRSISKSIPEYYSSLNFDNEFVLYDGYIWKLEGVNNARLFKGLKTVN